MKRKGLFVVVLVFLVSLMLLGSCKAYRTKQGVLRDTIYSVEHTGNGSWKVYMTHDDLAAFCTYDNTVGYRALDLINTHNGEVIIKFRAIDETDPEWSILNGSDCLTTNAADITVFHMLDIQPADSR